MQWHFLNSGYASGTQNMALDVDLAHRLIEEPGANVVRVYGWSPPAISLGWNQSEDAIDGDRVRAAGIDVVRRPTGGRAILHSEEITYAVIMVSSSKAVLELYNRISQALVAGLRTIGVDAALERSQPHFPSEYRQGSSVACFTSSARHEITVGGRKLVGSAQRRYARPDGNEVVLQHGSILLGPDHRRIAQFLPGSDPMLAERVERTLRRHTTDLLEVTGRRLPHDDVAEAIRGGFESTWEVSFERLTMATAAFARPAGTEERVHG